jgi:putative DNA primase/helicase
MSDREIATTSQRAELYPQSLKDRDWWVNWVLAVRYDEVEDGQPCPDATPTKQPVAPYDRDNAEPCRWNDGLDDDEHPTTNFTDVVNWDGWEVGRGIPAADRVLSDELGVGIIIPVTDGDSGDDSDRQPVTLLDWDDVRDPDTGEVHPLCAWALDELDTYAEISQSGEGIHQFVFGEIPGDFRKYLRHIDDKPFVGDDLPMVEMYSSGRLTAMTGQHVADSGTDVVDGQDLIDELCYRLRNNSNNSTKNPSHPFTDPDDGGETVPDTDEVAAIVAEDMSYDGDAPADWDSDRPATYEAVLRARDRKRAQELPSVSNWKLIRWAALLGKDAGLSKEQILSDLQDHPAWQTGDDTDRCRRHIRSAWRAADSDRLDAPTTPTLKDKGLLPADYVDLDHLGHDDHLNGAEKWTAWADARLGAGDAPLLPTDALRHVAAEEELYDFETADDVDGLPVAAHNAALSWVIYQWGADKLDIDDDSDPAEIVTERNFRAADADAIIASWEDVRYIYDKDKSAGRLAAERLLRSRHEFITTDEDDTLLVYNPDTGTYEHSLTHVKAEVHDGLGEHWSTHELNEIESRLHQQNFVERRQLNGREQFEQPHVCVENGVLNLFTGELVEHSPDHYFTERVPVAYDADADTSVYEEYLNDWTRRDEDRQALLEMVGHALVPDANERYKKFLILTGDADNGKSVFFRCVRSLLEGPSREVSNVANVKLEKMASNRFSKNSIYGHMANVAGEIDGKKILHTASLKDITGGDAVEIEPKGDASFFDTVNATMMFAANDPPILGERDKQAIASRIVPVELPYEFVEHPDPDDPFQKQREPQQQLEAELMTDEALSGLLRLAVDGVQRLEANGGDVSLPESPRERLQRYERAADPMREFGHRCLQNEDGSYVVKADVTTIYKEWATSQGHELGSNTHPTLHNALQGMKDLNYSTSRLRLPDYEDTDLPLRPWDERKRAVSRVSLTEEGLEYADAAGIVVDEPDDAEETSDTPSVVTPDTIDLETYDDREILPTLRASVPHVWKGDYGDPVTELQGPDGACVDLRFQGFDSPGLTPVEGGAEYEFDGLRVRNKPGERPYVEYRPTTSRKQVSAPPNSDDSDSGPDTDAAASSEQTQAATDGGNNDTAADTSTDADDGTDDPPNQKAKLRQAFERVAEGSEGIASRDDLVAHLSRWYDAKNARELIDTAESERGWLIERADDQYSSPLFE